MIARVRLWGRTIGAVSLAPGRDVAAFQYDPQFARSGIELSPLAMPLSERVYEFPALPLKSKDIAHLYVAAFQPVDLHGKEPPFFDQRLGQSGYSSGKRIGALKIQMPHIDLGWIA